jgi:hypothetical protein
MFKPKFEITNPEAIKLINDIKSGVFFAPVKAKIIRYKWFIVSGGVVLCLLLALAIGKAISRRAPDIIFLPPDIENPQPTTGSTVKSVYEDLRQDILNFSTDLPDPVIPPFDNAIDLQNTTL